MKNKCCKNFIGKKIVAVTISVQYIPTPPNTAREIMLQERVVKAGKVDRLIVWLETYHNSFNTGRVPLIRGQRLLGSEYRSGLLPGLVPGQSGLRKC